MMEGVRDLLFGTEGIAWLQQTFGLGHAIAFHLLSLLGDTWGMVLVVGVALWLFGRETAYTVIGIVVLGAVTKVALTEAFSTPRPRGPDIVVYDPLPVGSFPSGHVYEAVGPWGLLYAMGHVPLAVPVVAALLVGLGRLYLGAHHPVDVLGGIVFGVLLVWGYHRLWPRAWGWLSRRSPRFFAALALVLLAGIVGWLAVAGGYPRRYEIVGLALGAVVGIPLERRWVCFRPAPVQGRVRLAKLGIGAAGIALALLLDRSASPDALLLGTATAGAATLWAVLGAPALFVRLGWSAPAHEALPEDAAALGRPAQRSRLSARSS
jgi:membrane-associated phospholipid phosphatase